MNNVNNSTETAKRYNRNIIKLVGAIAGNATFSHHVSRIGETEKITMTFLRIKLNVKRLSGFTDTLEVVISEEKWIEFVNSQGCVQNVNLPETVVEITGRLQSHSYTECHGGQNKNKLDLFVFAKGIHSLPVAENNDAESEPDYESLNTVSLEGYLCKNPVIRQTPRGRTIADLFVAVNRQRGAAYIPVILWGGNAINAKDFKTGDKVRLDGRFQSREFRKFVDGETVSHTVYEMSASKVKLL